MREEIIAGRLAPGAPLRSEALRAAYGVSVAPLREALSQLAAERLVHQEDQRGFRVAPISPEELRDLAERRLELEPYALARSIATGGVDWEVRLIAAKHRLFKVSERLIGAGDGFDDEWECRHRELHIELLSECASPWLLRFCHQLYDHFDRYRRIAGADPGALQEIVGNREDPIVEASLARDGARARRLLRLHIRDSAKVIGRALFGRET